MKEIKTVEEILEVTHSFLDDSLGRCYTKDDTINAMHEYASQFEPKWIDASVKLPLCYQKGKWDGERSDLVNFIDDNGDKFLGRLYSGYSDGRYFEDWYHGKDEYCVDVPVLYWAPLPTKDIEK